MSKSDIIKESSPDGEETISTINPGPSVSPSSPESQCSVCLDELTNPSHSDSCLHSFCFKCLRRWSRKKQFCPLCKATFSYIYHSFDAMGVHRTHDVSRISSNESSSVDDSDENYGIRLSAGLNEQQDNTSYPLIFGEERRMQIYLHNLWAEPLQDTIGRIRDSSIDFFRNNPLERRRLNLFILRDIIAIRECLRLHNLARPVPEETIMTMTGFVMDSLLNCEIRQLHMLFRLKNFLDMHARHFCHELYNFANSPFEIIVYDSNVQYSYRPPLIESPEPLPIETIVLNSDDEEVQRPMITTDVISITNDSDDVIHSCFNPASIDQPSTSTGIRDSLNQPNNSYNDSDVEIIKHIIRPIKPLNSASIDQPSTSTGIRDSLNQPNNSGSFSNLSPIRRRMRSLGSSSDDEDSIVTTHGSKTASIKSQNINNKKKKKRKLNKKKNMNTKIPSNNKKLFIFRIILNFRRNRYQLTAIYQK